MQPCLPPEPHYRRPLLRTPFAGRAEPFIQTDAYIPWSGYTTVDVFSSVEQEYFSIRNACSVYDLTPMVKYRIAGPAAERYLNRLVTRNIAKLKPGRVAYTVWCNDAGHVIDDGTVFRLGPEEFRLCTAERQLDWLLDSAIGFDVEIAEVTETIAALSLQGPTACAVLKALGLAGVERLKMFDIGQFDLDGAALTVSRTGFTGDLGYEVWMDPVQAGAVWDRLMAAGRPHGIRPIGAQHGADRGRLPADQCRFHLGRTHHPHRPRPLALRARPRLAGRSGQGPFQRPPGLGRRTGAGPEAPPGRARYRGQQAGRSRAALCREGG
jgi:aminomethyltransferase